MSKRSTMLYLSAALFMALPLTPAGKASAGTPLQDAIAQLTPEQQATLKAYESARAAYARHVDQYWRLVDLKRRKRKLKIAVGKPLTVEDYVKEQPPVYNGPKRPDEIMAILPKPPRPPVEPHAPIPVIADFLREAEAIYGFRPDRVSEDDFMISYALEAIRLGLTRDQVVRLYALETGGMGTHDLQSGYNPRTGHAASTALGYAQLLAANSIEQIRKDGPEFAARLDRLAEEPSVSYSQAESLRSKAASIRRMIADARRVHESWPAHVAYAKTPNGLAMHALNLDGHVGPWMQVVKLRGVMEYAAKKGVGHLTGAQLELIDWLVREAVSRCCSRRARICRLRIFSSAEAISAIPWCMRKRGRSFSSGSTRSWTATCRRLARSNSQEFSMASPGAWPPAARHAHRRRQHGLSPVFSAGADGKLAFACKQLINLFR